MGTGDDLKILTLAATFANAGGRPRRLGKQETLHGVLRPRSIPIRIMKDRCFTAQRLFGLQVNFGYPEKSLLGKSPRMSFARDAGFDRVGRQVYTRLQMKAWHGLDQAAPRFIVFSADVIGRTAPHESAIPTGWRSDHRSRHHRAQAAEKTLQMFQFATDRAADAVFWINWDGTFFYVNDQACHSLGYAREELMQLRLFDIDPDYSEERWKDNWQRFDRTMAANRSKSKYCARMVTLSPSKSCPAFHEWG